MSKQSRKSGLSAGRPPLVQRSKKTLPSKVTRQIIRSHHQLHKQLDQAIKDGDRSKAAAIEREIEERGGLKVYQDASITGQSVERGGDSSKVLMQWLNDMSADDNHQKLRMLEVGALSVTNACSRSGKFAMTWIDLNSQDVNIVQQDFMKRPLPISDEDRFDVISLSLVVNYVPSPEGRGDMLQRTKDFLRHAKHEQLPLLFLVLPAPCVTNSRYMTEAHLDAIMIGLGFRKTQQKISPKLYYSLWTLRNEYPTQTKPFSKVEVNPGRTRNNFCIILR
jgi:25S rRNA (adenine2142-N1)-methyltransferase